MRAGNQVGGHVEVRHRWAGKREGRGGAQEVERMELGYTDMAGERGSQSQGSFRCFSLGSLRMR